MKQLLESKGVDFPAGSSAYFSVPGSQIAVRNTSDNLDKIDVIIKALKSEEAGE